MSEIDLLVQEINGVDVLEDSPGGIIQKTQLLPKEEDTPDLEYARMLDEFGLADVLGESAMFRAYRMKISGKWQHVTDLSTGQPHFGTWEEFLSTVSSSTGRSRQTIFDRVATYQKLAKLGYKPEDMIQKMTDSPGLYNRALKLLCDYDVRTDSIQKLNFKDDGEYDPDVAVNDLRAVIDELGTYGSAKDALDWVRTGILLEPAVSVFINDEGMIVVSWVALSEEDPDISFTGSVEFHPGSKVPDWLMAELSRRIK